MVSTDPYRLIMERKEELDLTWQDLADRLRIKYPQNVMDAARRGNLPDSYVKLAEALGCDIVIQLKPRPSDPKAFAWKVSRGRKYDRKVDK